MTPDQERADQLLNDLGDEITALYDAGTWTPAEYSRFRAKGEAIVAEGGLSGGDELEFIRKFWDLAWGDPPWLGEDDGEETAAAQ